MFELPCLLTGPDTLEQAHAQVRDAVRCHCDDSATRKLIRLHLVRDQVIAA